MNALIVYYSRTGLTEQVANVMSEKINCDLVEIEDNVDRSGFTGFVKSGWQAFAEKKPEIEDIDYKIEDYDIVIIGTPIWTGNVSSPVRSFLVENREKFNKVAFFCTFGGTGSSTTLDNMEVLAGNIPEATLSIRKRELDKGSYTAKIASFVNTLNN